jgi:general stress protein YciG
MTTNAQDRRNTGETRHRGFASMDQAKQREIASKGGQAAHRKGVAHEFSPEEARIAGRKGGQVAHQRGTAHQFSSEEARIAGRKGGQASHQKNAARRAAAAAQAETFTQGNRPADEQTTHRDQYEQADT